MQTNKVFIPAKIKTKLDNMNLSDRFLFNETVEDLEIYNMIVEILMNEDGTLYQVEMKKKTLIIHQKEYLSIPMERILKIFLRNILILWTILIYRLCCKKDRNEVYAVMGRKSIHKRRRLGRRARRRTCRWP